MIKICKKCGNTTFNNKGQCVYCIWKGDTGLGLQLKNTLKKQKKEKSNEKNC